MKQFNLLDSRIPCHEKNCRWGDVGVRGRVQAWGWVIVIESDGLCNFHLKSQYDKAFTEAQSASKISGEEMKPIHLSWCQTWGHSNMKSPAGSDHIQVRLPPEGMHVGGGTECSNCSWNHDKASPSAMEATSPESSNHLHTCSGVSRGSEGGVTTPSLKP